MKDGLPPQAKFSFFSHSLSSSLISLISLSLSHRSSQQMMICYCSLNSFSHKKTHQYCHNNRYVSGCYHSLSNQMQQEHSEQRGKCSTHSSIHLTQVQVATGRKANLETLTTSILNSS